MDLIPVGEIGSVGGGEEVLGFGFKQGIEVGVEVGGQRYGFEFFDSHEEEMVNVHVTIEMTDNCILKTKSELTVSKELKRSKDSPHQAFAPSPRERHRLLTQLSKYNPS